MTRSNNTIIINTGAIIKQDNNTGAIIVFRVSTKSMTRSNNTIIINTGAIIKQDNNTGAIIVLTCLVFLPRR